jgi:uncharacterized membrane-anchored protein
MTSTANPMTAVNPIKPLRSWRLWLPLGVQALLLLSIAIPPLYTEIAGRTVILKTVPIDPYDPLRGYSQTLSYEISRFDSLRTLPGWKTLPQEINYDKKSYLTHNTSFYLVLQAPKNNSEPPQPWKPIKIQTSLPTNLPIDQVALKGRVNYAQIEYGLETYYMPEALRTEVNDEVLKANRNKSGAMEIKVDAKGEAVAIRLWAGKRSYRF